MSHRTLREEGEHPRTTGARARGLTGVRLGGISDYGEGRVACTMAEVLRNSYGAFFATASQKSREKIWETPGCVSACAEAVQRRICGEPLYEVDYH